MEASAMWLFTAVACREPGILEVLWQSEPSEVIVRLAARCARRLPRECWGGFCDFVRRVFECPHEPPDAMLRAARLALIRAARKHGPTDVLSDFGEHRLVRALDSGFEVEVVMACWAIRKLARHVSLPASAMRDRLWGLLSDRQFPYDEGPVHALAALRMLPEYIPSAITQQLSLCLDDSDRLERGLRDLLRLVEAGVRHPCIAEFCVTVINTDPELADDAGEIVMRLGTGEPWATHAVLAIRNEEFDADAIAEMLLCNFCPQLAEMVLGYLQEVGLVELGVKWGELLAAMVLARPELAGEALRVVSGLRGRNAALSDFVALEVAAAAGVADPLLLERVLSIPLTLPLAKLFARAASAVQRADLAAEFLQRAAAWSEVSARSRDEIWSGVPEDFRELGEARRYSRALAELVGVNMSSGP